MKPKIDFEAETPRDRARSLAAMLKQIASALGDETKALRVILATEGPRIRQRRRVHVDVFERDTAAAFVGDLWRVLMKTYGPREPLYWLRRIDLIARKGGTQMFANEAHEQVDRGRQFSRAVRAWRSREPGARKATSDSSGERSLRGKYVEAAAFMKLMGITTTPTKLSALWKAHAKS